MRNSCLVLVFVLLSYSCKTVVYTGKNKGIPVYGSVQVDTLFQDNISIRSIIIDSNKIWYSANNSRVGYFDLKENRKQEQIVGMDSMKLEFRSAAQTEKNVFALTVSNPALLYKISKKEFHPVLVYQENHEKVFYDSMQFWNHNEGIAIGDPVGDCLSIIITRDGGNSWKKISCTNLPKVVEGEAAFAASNTNVVVRGNHTWIVTGGKKARVLYSNDKGVTWQVFETPIVQGKEMAGIFTADFYDANVGFIAGGDYGALNQNHGNKARTKNGGKTWDLVAENEGFGYASCIQYVPGSNGKSLVSVGANGIYYSFNSGNSWKQLALDPSLYTIRFIDDHTAIAAGKNKMIRIQFIKENPKQ